MLVKLIKKRGQTSLEYIVLIVIVLAVFLGVGNYFKRGISGRWKAAIDDMGDQYDPRATNGSIRHTILSNTITQIMTINAAGGFWTSREDGTSTIEKKSGYIATGAF